MLVCVFVIKKYLIDLNETWSVGRLDIVSLLLASSG